MMYSSVFLWCDIVTFIGVLLHRDNIETLCLKFMLLNLTKHACMLCLEAMYCGLLFNGYSG